GRIVLYFDLIYCSTFKITTMHKNYIALFTIFFGMNLLLAQGTTVKVIDSATGESIPYANVSINNSENLVSNAEGFFTVPESTNDNSAISLSYIGYVGQTVTLSKIRAQNNTIRLIPGVYELADVDVSKAKQDPNAI